MEIQLPMRWIIYTILLLQTARLTAQTQAPMTMGDFVGINSNVAAYDQKYLEDLANCTRWIREYHSWAHYEAADNYYKWDDITTEPQGHTWPHHTKFMEKCHELGINVLIDVLNKPSWAGSDKGAYSIGDGSKASDYLDKLEFMGQLVARYGSQKIDSARLETADKVSGLNYITYYEDDNEPDFWWFTPLWPAEKYALYCNAVHDGYGVQPSEEYPLLGIKSVDPNAQHVLAGMTTGGIDYLQTLLDHSHGRVPFDVLNIHTYCTDHKNAYAPENEDYGLEKRLETFMRWKQEHLPNTPVWITEFGWDTRAEDERHSYVYAPPLQQANYILRSYFILLHMGFEKAFLFMDKDPNSNSIIQYSTSGIISDWGTGLQKKPSYYYLATLQHVLGNAVPETVPAYRQAIGNYELYCFRFSAPQQQQIYVMWTRLAHTATDSGATMPYTLKLGFRPEYAYVVTPTDQLLHGKTDTLQLAGSHITLNLTETPQFLVVGEPLTERHEPENSTPRLCVYPNPTHHSAVIQFSNPQRQHITLSLLTPEGKTLQTIVRKELQPGLHHFQIQRPGPGGLYYILLQTTASRETKKLVFR